MTIAVATGTGPISNIGIVTGLPGMSGKLVDVGINIIETVITNYIQNKLSNAKVSTQRKATVQKASDIAFKYIRKKYGSSSRSRVSKSYRLRSRRPYYYRRGQKYYTK